MKPRSALFYTFCFLLALLALAVVGLIQAHIVQTRNLRRLVILYTNDEHGWMETTSQGGGAAGLMQQWMRREGYQPNDPQYLVLSGGDMWTGAAISTYFDGRSTVAVMNAIGYDAAAIGNHDFDFGLEALRQRAAEAQFTLLSANIRDGKTDAIPDFARPYVILDANGIRLGIIGLTTTETPLDTQPATVAGLDFLPYKDALQEFVPQVKAEGAELVLVIGHICGSEMRSLAPLAHELGVAMIGGGHCHEQIVSSDEDIVLVQAASNWTAYGVVELSFDTAAGRLVHAEAHLRRNPPGKSEPQIANIVADWRARLDAEMGEVIGYAKNTIPSDSDTMARFITTAWLAADPSAQIALASPRYIQTLHPGPITPATILSVLPTDNRLLRIELSGAQLAAVLQARPALLGGLAPCGESYCLANGSPLDDHTLYRVLLPENLYHGGDHYDVQQYDRSPEDSGVDWRQALIAWLVSHKTSPSFPLEQALQQANTE